MGLFGSAGIDVNKVSDDAYGFGNDFWPIFVKEVRAPKVSDSGKFGMYVIFEIAHDRYSNVKEFGRWIQLPTPIEIQHKFGTTFDVENDPKDAKVASFLIKWLKAIGFKMDEIAADLPDPKVTDPNDPRRIQGRFFLARLSVREDENGYDKINWRNPSPMPDAGSPEGMAMFAPKPAADTRSELEKALAGETDPTDADI